jgi:hypothetical protein
MSEPGPGSEEDRRVAELLRVNEELAAEIRNIVRGVPPRSGQLPTARRLAQLTRERDAANAELHRLRAERASLHTHNTVLQREVNRLRSGFLGLLRRTRARLLGAKPY